MSSEPAGRWARARARPGAGGSFPGAVAGGLAAAVLSAAALAAWNAAEAFLMEQAYRSSLGMLAGLLFASFPIYFALALAPAIVFSLARRWPLLGRSRIEPAPGLSSWLRDVVSVSAGIASFFFAVGILTSAESWNARGAGAHAVEIAFAAAVAFAVAGLIAHLTEPRLRRPRRAVLIRNLAALAGAAPCSLIIWEVARDSLGDGRGRFVEIFMACVAVGAGLSFALGAQRLGRLALRGARRVRAASAPARRRAALSLGALGLLSAGAAGSAWWIASFGHSGPEGRRPNVLFLVADTTRADHIGCYGSARARTPNIDALAAKGVRVDKMYATASWTAPTTASLLTGLYPDGHGLLSYRDRIREGTISVASMFREEGYETAGFSANPILTARYGFGEGFGTWEEDLHPGLLRRHRRSPLHATLKRFGLLTQWEHFPRAESVMDRALDWLDSPRRGPFFLYLQFMDAHDPYDPPPPFDSMFGGPPSLRMRIGTISEIMAARRPAARGELQQMIDLYDGALSYIDDVIGRLLSAMSERGLLDNTIVVFTGDHGEEFLEHGDLEHTRTIYDEIVRVPFIIAGKGVAGGRVLDGPVRQVDVAPTLLQAAGVRQEAYMDGRSIWPSVSGSEPLEPRRAFMSMVYLGFRSPWHSLRGVREGDIKAISTSPSPLWEEPRSWELYDLSEDPAERRDLAVLEQDRLSGLREAIEAWTHRPNSRGQVPAPTDEETQRRLRALGYLD